MFLNNIFSKYLDFYFRIKIFVNIFIYKVLQYFHWDAFLVFPRRFDTFTPTVAVVMR